MAFFIGFFISFALFYVVNQAFPPKHLGEFDETDNYGTFTIKEASRLGIMTVNSAVEPAYEDLKEAVVETQVTPTPRTFFNWKR